MTFASDQPGPLVAGVRSWQAGVEDGAGLAGEDPLGQVAQRRIASAFLFAIRLEPGAAAENQPGGRKGDRQYAGEQACQSAGSDASHPSAKWCPSCVIATTSPARSPASGAYFSRLLPRSNSQVLMAPPAR